MTPQIDALNIDGSWSPEAQGQGAVHTCPQTDCNRQFNRKYTLIEHLKTHTGEKPHVCPVRSCGKRFSTSGNLSRHKRLHGTIEPLGCPVEGCACTFPSENKLEKHMKFHLGSAVHVCVVRGCGKTFSTTGNLNRHLKHHHQDVDVDSMSPSSSSPNSQSHQSPTSADQLRNSSAAGRGSWWFHGADRDDPMVPTMDQLDALTAIFDEEIAIPMAVKAESPRVSILDDMISFHVTHIGVHT